MAVKPRPVICMYDIVPIGLWNRMRASESSPSNFISVEGSSCTSPRFPFTGDDLWTTAAPSFRWHLSLCHTRLEQKNSRISLLIVIFMWQSMRLEYFYKILWQFLVHDYSCIIRYEIILISQRVRHKYRLSQSGTSMTVTVNNIRRIKPKECRIYRVLPPFYTL